MHRVSTYLIAAVICIIFFWYGTHYQNTAEFQSSAPADLERLVQTKINWRNWTPATFSDAKQQGKPIFLYLAPFWCSECYQMDVHSFSNDLIASKLNSDYIPIKIDSEQRPDIFDHYQLGGYPSCVVLTPDGKTFGGSTYLSTDSLDLLLNTITRFWDTRQESIIAQADLSHNRYRQALDSVELSEPLELVLLKAGLALGQQFDSTYGGFGTQPKFPQPEVNEFLLISVDQSGAALYPDLILNTLDAQFALSDTVWGGYYRYARFADWTFVSHEKLLEDNAKLLENYVDAYQVTHRQEYKQAAMSIIDYIDSFLKSERGWGFNNSQHSDYIDEDTFIEGETYYAMSQGERLTHGLPPVDRSSYTGSNCRAVSAYLNAARALGIQSCGDFAITTLDIIRSKARGRNGGFYHDATGQCREPFGLLSDQIAIGSALLDAYEVTGSKSYLYQARNVANFVITRFFDQEIGGLYSRSSTEGKEIGRMAVRIKLYGVNCQAVEMLMRLYHMTAFIEYKNAAGAIIRYLSAVPLALEDLRRCQLATAYLWYNHEPIKFVITGKWDKRYQQLLGEVWETYYPRSIIIQMESGEEELIIGEHALSSSENPQLFVFTQGVHSSPIEDPATAAQQIRDFLRSHSN